MSSPAHSEQIICSEGPSNSEVALRSDNSHSNASAYNDDQNTTMLLDNLDSCL